MVISPSNFDSRIDLLLLRSFWFKFVNAHVFFLFFFNFHDWLRIKMRLNWTSLHHGRHKVWVSILISSEGFQIRTQWKRTFVYDRFIRMSWFFISQHQRIFYTLPNLFDLSLKISTWNGLDLLIITFIFVTWKLFKSHSQNWIYFVLAEIHHWVRISISCLFLQRLLFSWDFDWHLPRTFLLIKHFWMIHWSRSIHSNVASRTLISLIVFIACLEFWFWVLFR